MSDLGGGKTTFTKGLARGLGSDAVVSSPTFTVSRVYECRDNLRLHHFDFYRLQEGGMVGRELDEVVQEDKSVVAVEWGDVVNEVIPTEHIKIKLGRTAEGEDIRVIDVTYPEKFSYIFEAMA